MASPALWSVYLDLLIKELRQLGFGCHVAGMYMGAVVYWLRSHQQGWIHYWGAGERFYYYSHLIY